MSFDNLCKLLSEKYPERFATWILGAPPTSLKVLKTELSIEPIRADSVILLQTAERILHLEFQVKLESEPPLPLRMLDYWVRLYRLYRLPITQVVVLLIPPTETTQIETVFNLESTRHEYRVMKLWEEDPAIFLNDLALLPLATLAAATVPEQLLRQVAERVSQIESEQQRQEVSAYVQLLAGLKFKKPLIRQVFREGVMRESVIYQEIYQEGAAKGEVKGRAEGRQEGRQEGERSLVLRLLTRRVGAVPTQLSVQIEALPLEQLEALGEALLDFRAIADLETWLQADSES
jgi:predicted transposase/invertase (TIGR01784 family)